MTFANPSTLALAVLVDSPALYDAFVTQEMPVSTALLRYLIAVPVCGLMLAGLRALTQSYERERQRAQDMAEAEAALLAVESMPIEPEPAPVAAALSPKEAAPQVGGPAIERRR